ncbi:Phosphotransferase enzyme family protein [Rhizobium sp. NFR07]|nr:Phosphotransferase enzyme family protein [Rhizobium sp. NFR07]
MDQPPIELWNVTAPLERLGGGFRNIVFHTVGLPQDLVFKSTRRSTAALEWLSVVQDFARASGFIVPSFVRSRNGLLIESGWTCEEFLVGEPFAKEDLPSILPEISRFHQLAATITQRPGFASSEELTSLLAGGDIDLSTMPPELAELCRHAWREVSGLPATAVHADLNAGNLLRCHDGRPALLDWDECRRDLAIFDLGQLIAVRNLEQRAILAWEVACSWNIEPDHAREVEKRLHSKDREITAKSRKS